MEHGLDERRDIRILAHGGEAGAELRVLAYIVCHLSPRCADEVMAFFVDIALGENMEIGLLHDNSGGDKVARVHQLAVSSFGIGERVFFGHGGLSV